MSDLLDAVRRSYEALGRGDLEGTLAMMDDEIVWHQAQGLPGGGTYHGRGHRPDEHLRPGEGVRGAARRPLRVTRGWTDALAAGAD